MYRTEVLEYVLKRALELDPFSEFITPNASNVALDQYKEDNNSAIEFWNEFNNRFQWDILPPAFLYDLYCEWYSQEHNGDKKSAFSKKVFLQHLQNHLRQNDTWEFKANRETCMSPIYVGSSMDKDEPLITEYNLVRFMNPDYKGSDPEKRRAFKRPTSARGIVKT